MSSEVTTYCHASIATMCENDNYKQCPLNLFNFFSIICIYYKLYYMADIGAWFVNLPVIVLTLPFLFISLFLYLFYLLGLPLAKVFAYFFPTLNLVLIQAIVFFVIGLSNVRLSKLFKVR